MENQPITTEQALNLLMNAATNFRGTRQEHEMIERAYRTLLPLVEPKKDDPKSPKSK